MSDLERKSPDESGNLSAIDSISSKLLEVTKLAEKLDAKLSEAGARNRGIPENLETSDLIKQDDKFVGNSSNRLSSPRLVSSIVEMKKEEKKENVIETLDEKKFTDNVEDSNVEEYVTATECSTTPVFRSRSESILTCSEYEDAVNALASRNMDLSSSPAEYVIPTISSRKSESAIIKPIAIKSAVTSPAKQEATECDRAVSIQRFIEEKTGKVVKEVTETTTLRVSHDTRLGVSSYKLVSNTISDNHDHCDIKTMQDLKLTLENETAPAVQMNTSETTKYDISRKATDSENSKRTNGHFSGFHSKPWSPEQEEQSYTSNISNGSASMIKYSKIKMLEARQANVKSSNFDKKEESKEVERKENAGFEEDEFFSRARMVSRAEEVSQSSKFRMALQSSLSVCE